MNTTSIVSLVVAVLTAVSAAFSTQIQAFIGSHPTVSALVAGLWVVISHYLPAPTNNNVVKPQVK